MPARAASQTNFLQHARPRRAGEGRARRERRHRRRQRRQRRRPAAQVDRGRAVRLARPRQRHEARGQGRGRQGHRVELRHDQRDHDLPPRRPGTRTPPGCCRRSSPRSASCCCRRWPGRPARSPGAASRLPAATKAAGCATSASSRLAMAGAGAAGGLGDLVLRRHRAACRCSSGPLDPLLYALQVLSPIALFGLLVLAGWNLWTARKEKRGWFALLWAVLLRARRGDAAVGGVRLPHVRLRHELLRHAAQADVARGTVRVSRAVPHRRARVHRDKGPRRGDRGRRQCRARGGGGGLLSRRRSRAHARIRPRAPAPSSKRAPTGRSCSPCFRPAAPATRSTARCGISKPGARDSRCGSWRGSTGSSRCRRP